ncbi:MAG TPA: tetratricopeptide repeat protein [Polyangia bacterium]|nr:tetratricopeptide repeat protein [Polyangia bacterium]
MATGKPFAAQAFISTAKLLDEYVRRWASSYQDACEATHVRGDQSEEVLDLRMSCLDNRLGNVRALSDVLVRADDGVVLNAVNAAGALPSLDGCADVAALRAVVKPPVDPATRARVGELRTELARVTALRDSGQCAAAEASGVPLIAAAHATKYRPLEGEVLDTMGLLGNFCSDPSVSVARLKEAYAAAVAGRDDAVAAEAAACVPILDANRLGQIAEARDWVNIGTAALERLGGNARIEGNLLSGEATVYGAEHDYDKWVSTTRQAQVVTTRALGPEHPLSIGALSNLGDALAGAQRFEEALEVDRAARTVGERVLGRDQPQVANTINNECEVLNHLHRFADARVACERAIEIWRAAGTGDAIQSYGLTGLGLALLGAGKPSEAIAPLEQAVATRESSRLAPELQSESRFALARALWSRTADRPRALSLARQAKSDVASNPKVAAPIEAWLADKR